MAQRGRQAAGAAARRAARISRLAVCVAAIGGLLPGRYASAAEPAAGAAAVAPKAAWRAVPGGERAVVALPSAPFPNPGKPYGDPSVWLFVPAAAVGAERVDVVVHYHGFESVLAETVPGFALEAQVAASGRPAVLVVPQGPVMARDGDFGKLMAPGGLERLLADVEAVLRRDGRLTGAVGDLVLSAHSGGYRAVARAIDHGAPVREVLLFDALYGDVATFAAFAERGGRLRSVHTEKGGTRGANLQLRQQLLARGVAVADRVDGEGVVIAPTALDHNTCLYDGGLAAWLR